MTRRWPDAGAGGTGAVWVGEGRPALLEEVVDDGAVGVADEAAVLSIPLGIVSTGVVITIFFTRKKAQDERRDRISRLCFF